MYDLLVSINFDLKIATYYRIPIFVLLEIARAISVIFPGEKFETYFIPYRKEGGITLKQVEIFGNAIIIRKPF